MRMSIEPLECLPGEDDRERWGFKIFWGDKDENLAYEIVSRHVGEPQHVIVRKLAAALNRMATVVELSENEPEGL